MAAAPPCDGDCPARRMTKHEIERLASARRLALELVGIYGATVLSSTVDRAALRILSTMTFCERERVLIETRGQN